MSASSSSCSSVGSCCVEATSVRGRARPRERSSWRTHGFERRSPPARPRTRSGLASGLTERRIRGRPSGCVGSPCRRSSMPTISTTCANRTARPPTQFTPVLRDRAGHRSTVDGHEGPTTSIDPRLAVPSALPRARPRPRHRAVLPSDASPRPRHRAVPRSDRRPHVRGTAQCPSDRFPYIRGTAQCPARAPPPLRPHPSVPRSPVVGPSRHSTVRPSARHASIDAPR